ncbi:MULTISPECIES: Na+/H+ antiporter subunit D [unclassified Ensifer]|uniref:Na+/H+ antiporter subunit D n=1 Tax=unclassified Ensifer TaxID=2633371 RepID=UPI000813D055|nr:MULTISPECIES: Na+/H+ antiporter subunit D [unclassified Ensifer]OCP07101.1 cation:proton antiporter [Ensifer sp. LC11]OCP07684.1 cation:proton antiporter [Ensifer sp. LC13]OCP12155.1 cation:proton antiporter [Ensifer sp. LC14]OCP31867.1 cation:proton antiporter [Ensifer sp. LC499]
MAASTPSPADLSAALVLEPVASADWLVILPVAWCLAIGALLVMLRRQIDWHPYIAVLGLAGLVLIDVLLLRHVLASGPVTMVMGRWLPPFGIAFTVDLTGALFALTASVVALAGAIYSLADINDSGRRYGFYPFLMLLMAGVSGAFLTGDVFNLYVWFEVLLISSFGLIVLGSEREQIDGAVKYGFLNLVATTLFLITTGYLYASFGTLNMADIARKAEGLSGTAPLMTLTALFVLAFGMKAAAFPVNFWLPASYHTPRVVVSALFAGLLTKVGIYALIRITVMLLPLEREQLSFVIAVAGALTMLVGAFGALAQSDFRRMLGYLVVSGIGSILAGVAVGGPGGIGGAIFYALHSMLVMTALYFASGVAAKLGGSFSLASLAGLYRRHAGFAALTLMLCFAVSGLPPFSGFWPKVMLVKAALDIGAWWLAAALLVTGFLTTVVTGRFFLLAYWRDRADTTDTPHSVTISPAALLPLTALTMLVLAIGLYPELLLSTIQSAAAGLGEPSAYLNSVFPGGAP